MADKKKAGCVVESTGLIEADTDDAQSGHGQTQPPKEEIKVQAQVGKEAPDFELTAYHEGGFKNVKLSEYRGKWVLLCFYPGDFTFV